MRSVPTTGFRALKPRNPLLVGGVLLCVTLQSVPAAEKKARARMMKLEKISEGSRSMHPVLALDRATRAFRVFRSAESNRVLASYGSGNGGDLAAFTTIIDMNIARARLLTGEADAR